MIILNIIIILIGGFLLGYLTKAIKLPKIIGMIMFGILIGPSVLNIISPNLIKIAPYLRQIALVIILTRSGLSIDYKKIYEIGFSAILLALIPATFEIISIVIFGPLLLNITILEALLLGSVLAAVSPAIVVPRMIKLKNEKYGTNSGVPELVMAGASIDDIYVIILFYSFLGLMQGGSLNVVTFISIPLAIIFGILIGVLIGMLFNYLITKFNFNKIILVISLLIISLLLVYTESLITSTITFSALLSIVTIGVTIMFKSPKEAVLIEGSYKKMWFVFEIVLFVLVGISVDLKFAVSSGFMPVLILFIGLVFRSIGVFIALLFTRLNLKEKLFTIFSYIPKATVQASIGAIALNEGLVVGPLVLTMAVLSILITAPIGAILIDNSYKKLLTLDI